MSSQVKYIYIAALFTIQIVSKLLHCINQDNIIVFVYSWKKTIKFGRADQWYNGSFNLNIPNWASQRQQWEETEKLHQVVHYMEKIL